MYISENPKNQWRVLYTGSLSLSPLHHETLNVQAPESTAGVDSESV